MRYAIEVLPMITLNQTCHSQGCGTEVPDGFDEGGLCLEHYLAEATQRLDATADSFRCGLGVDNETLGWLLLQVDFVVETIGNEALALSQEEQSKLLELLLGVANLNEYIRHNTATFEQAP